MDKLCPFCGGNDCYSVDDYGDVSVKCLYLSHGENWNTRPLEDKLQTNITTLLLAMAKVLPGAGWDNIGILLKAMREVDSEWEKRLTELPHQNAPG